MTVIDSMRKSADRSPPGVRYHDVLRVPDAAQLLIGTLVGRLPTGMAPLAILLSGDHGTGYGTTAGPLAALYLVASAVGALSVPAWSINTGSGVCSPQAQAQA